MVRLIWIVALLVAMASLPTLAQEETGQSQIVQGTCSSLGNAITELSPLSFPEDAPTGAVTSRTAGTSFTVAPLILTDLLNNPRALLVTIDGRRVACSEIGGSTNSTGDLVIGLTGVADSDAFGIAYMSPNDTDPSQTDVSLFVVPPTNGQPEATTASASQETVAISDGTTDTPAILEATPPPPSDVSPLAESSGVELLYFVLGTPSQYVDSTPIYGELRNTTASLMSAPKLNITFYDAEDQIIDTAEVDALISVLRPGESMPIDGRTDLAPGSWTRTEFTFQGASVADNIALIFYAQDLEVQDVNEVEKTDDSLRVLGQIHNGGAVAANLLSVKVLFYDAEGRFAGYNYGHTSGDSVAAGGNVPFEFDRSVDLAPGWTYRIIVSGWPE